MASALVLYDPLDVIGNGSFGIIRKVRRKSDGLVCISSLPTKLFFIYILTCVYSQIFARKELNFERMTERDRKQIVAEVSVTVIPLPLNRASNLSNLLIRYLY